MAKKKMPAILFYTGDWLKDPAVRCVSLGARGLWIDMLSLMYESPIRGYLSLANGSPINTTQLARMVGSNEKEIAPLLEELSSCGVYSIDSKGVIFSRRMVADELEREAKSKAGKEGMRKRYEKTGGDITEPLTESKNTDNKVVTALEYENENVIDSSKKYIEERKNREKLNASRAWERIPKNRWKAKSKFFAAWKEVVDGNGLDEDHIIEMLVRYYNSDDGKSRWWRYPSTLILDEFWEEENTSWSNKRGEQKFPESPHDHDKIISEYVKLKDVNKKKIEKLKENGQEAGVIAYKIWKNYPDIRSTVS